MDSGCPCDHRKCVEYYFVFDKVRIGSKLESGTRPLLGAVSVFFDMGERDCGFPIVCLTLSVEVRKELGRDLNQITVNYAKLRQVTVVFKYRGRGSGVR